uniref:Sorting nexin 19 n=1 Tax=Latimeria chalumnae TaxID=7897 RepID=H2ZXY4_LATCH
MKCKTISVTRLQQKRAFTEMSENRKLVGLLGAVLVWILVVYLLINVWLLIVCACLMFAFGGWFGSQGILSADVKVHLERFIKLEPTPKSPDSEEQLEKEIGCTITKIIRDFVSSWYKTVSREPEFEEEVKWAMHYMAKELQRRIEKVDRKLLAQNLLNLCGCHLKTYTEMKESIADLDKKALCVDPKAWGKQLWKVYSERTSPHPALQSPTMEVNYARGMVDMLLHVLVPKPHLETRTGRFVVRELITCNVLLPLITKMSDPDCINLIIVAIFSKSSKKLAKVEEPPSQPDVPSSLSLEVTFDNRLLTPKSLELSSYDVVDNVEYNDYQELEDLSIDDSNDVVERKSRSISMDYLRPDTLNPLFFYVDSEPESPLSEVGRDSDTLALIEADEMDRFKGSASPAYLVDVLEALEGVGSDEVDAKDMPVLDPMPGLQALVQKPEVHLGKVCPASETKLDGHSSITSSIAALPEETISIFSSRPTFQEREISISESSVLSSEDFIPGSSLHTFSPTTGLPSLPTFSFEPLSSPDAPVIIQNLRISGTITAKEHRGTGSHPYTLYTVKYETALDSENAGGIQQVAYHTVNRRYSEFLNLQTRLEEKTELRKLIKNIKGPKKLFPDLPFGNMDSDKVEARKSLLETFLKQLCAISEIANSEEMQEFLALNTDARIAFVKKPFVVSRIDKIVVNAIVDTLKTAFPRSEPQSPTEELGETEVDGKTQAEGKKPNKSRLRFSSGKIAPVLTVAEMQGKTTYCFGDGSAMWEGPSLPNMEDFILEQERLLLRPRAELEEENTSEEKVMTMTDVDKKAKSAQQDPADQTECSGKYSRKCVCVCVCVCVCGGGGAGAICLHGACSLD